MGIEDLRFRDTRHTRASLLVQNGVPKGMNKVMGGWKSDSMVERGMRTLRPSAWRGMRR